jgi:hypothetical protein
MTRKQKFLSISVVLIMPVILAGCGKSLSDKAAEKMIESSTGGDVSVDSDGGNMEIITDQGSLKTGGDIDLPSDFPSDIYLADGKILSYFKNNSNQGMSLTINSSQSVQDLGNLYKDKLTSSGWAIESSMIVSGTSVLGAAKGNQDLSVMVSDYTEGEGSMITIVLTNK